MSKATDTTFRINNIQRIADSIFNFGKVSGDTSLLALSSSLSLNSKTGLPDFIDHKYDVKIIKDLLSRKVDDSNPEILLHAPVNANFILIYLAVIAYLIDIKIAVRVGASTDHFFSFLELYIHPASLRDELKGLLFPVNYDYNDKEETSRVYAKFKRVMVWGGSEKIKHVMDYAHNKDVLVFPPRISAAIIPLSDGLWPWGKGVNGVKSVRRLLRDTFSEGNTLCSSPKYWIFSCGDDSKIQEYLRHCSNRFQWRQTRRSYNDLLDVNASFWLYLSEINENLKWVCKFGPFYFVRLIDPRSRVKCPSGVVQCVTEREWSTGSSGLEPELQTVIFPDEDYRQKNTAIISQFPRAVPYGNALVFSSTWDGKDIIGWLRNN